MIRHLQLTPSGDGEQARFAPRGFALPRQWTALPDLQGSLKPTCWVLLGLLLADVYLFAGLNAPPGFIALIPLFLPRAVILAVLLLTPRRQWAPPLAVYYVYLVLHAILRGNPPAYAALADLADVFNPLVAALLIGRLVPGPLQFRSLHSVSGYSASVILASLLGATWAVTARVVFIGSPFWDSWSTWFFSDVLPGLVIAPMLIMWAQVGRQGLRAHSRARLIEVAALSVAFLLLGWLLLTPSAGDELQREVQRSLSIPLLVWAAVRFGPRGLLSALSAVLVLSIAVASREAALSTASNVATFQVFFLAVGVPLFGLAALLQERREAGEQLEQSEARYRAIVASLPHGAVLLFGPDLRHFFADGQGLPLLGMSGEQIQGKTLFECFPFALAARLEPHYRAALSGGHSSFELTYAGRTYQAEVRPATARDRPAGMLLLRDVTN